MSKYWTNPKRIRFRALIEGFLEKRPNDPLPPLSHYARMLGVDIRSLREWARIDFSDIYMDTEGWPSLDELGKAMAKRSRLHEANGERKIELPPPDAKRMAMEAANAPFDAEVGLPWS